MLTTGSGSVTAAYDPMTRLAQVVGAATTKFAYDGVDSLAEYDGAGSLQRRFVFDPTTGQPVVQYEGTGVAAANRRYLSQDERGSVISTVSSAGALIGINTYDEYGIPGAANAGRFQYTGQKWIGELALYDYKFRMYSPALGRFAQTDPIGYADSPNLYNYVLGDPVNLVDPLGLEGSGEVVHSGQPSCVLQPALCITITGERLHQPDPPTLVEVGPHGGVVGGNESGGGAGGDAIVITGQRFRPLNNEEIHFYSRFYDPNLLRGVILLNGLPPWMSESEFNGLTVSKKFIYISSRLYSKNMLSNRISAALLGHELYHAMAQYANGVTIWDFIAASAACRCTGSGSSLEKPAYLMESVILQMYNNGVR